MNNWFYLDEGIKIRIADEYTSTAYGFIWKYNK